MTQQQPTSTGNRVLQGVAAFFRFLLRLIFVVLLAVLLGVGLYFGAPWIYRNLVQPVQDNAARIAVLEQRVEQERARFREESRQFQERIASLETDIAQLQEETALQAQAQQEIEQRVQDIEGQLTRTEDLLEGLQQEVQEVRSDLDATASDLTQQTDNAQERLDGLEARLTLLQAAQDLLKVRLLLSEDNLVGARQAVRLAVTHLDQAVRLMPEEAERLMDLQERLREMDSLIASRSFRAFPELESAWATMIEIIVPPLPQPTATPPGPTPTPTPAP